MTTSTQITAETRSGAAILHLAGEIDETTLPQLESAVNQTADPALVLDCAELRFINSKVVGYLAYLQTHLTKTNRKLLIAATNETLDDILSLVGLMDIIPHFPTLEAALQSLNHA